MQGVSQRRKLDKGGKYSIKISYEGLLMEKPTNQIHYFPNYGTKLCLQRQQVLFGDLYRIECSRKQIWSTEIQRMGITSVMTIGVTSYSFRGCCDCKAEQSFVMIGNLYGLLLFWQFGGLIIGCQVGLLGYGKDCRSAKTESFKLAKCEIIWFQIPCVILPYKFCCLFGCF